MWIVSLKKNKNKKLCELWNKAQTSVCLPIINRVKYVFYIWVLKILIFGTWVSIRIIDHDTSVLEKDQISISVKFSVQKLTAR